MLLPGSSIFALLSSGLASSLLDQLDDALTARLACFAGFDVVLGHIVLAGAPIFVGWFVRHLRHGTSSLAEAVRTPSARVIRKVELEGSCRNSRGSRGRFETDRLSDKRAGRAPARSGERHHPE